jgi:hypothetical protein
MAPTTPPSRSSTQRPTVPAQRGEPATAHDRPPQHAAPVTARDARGRFLPRYPAHALREPMAGDAPGCTQQPATGAPTASDHRDDPVARRPFTYAGLRWKPDEDRVDGAWIGYRLARELYHRRSR